MHDRKTHDAGDQMTKNEKIMTVLNALYDDNQDPEYASPNLVAEYARLLDIELSSEDVVFISNVYGEDHCPSGRSYLSE